VIEWTNQSQYTYQNNYGNKRKKRKRKDKKIKFSHKQVEMFARRIMPEIKRYFTDENVKKEFLEWQKKRQKNKT